MSDQLTIPGVERERAKQDGIIIGRLQRQVAYLYQSLQSRTPCTTCADCRLSSILRALIAEDDRMATTGEVDATEMCNLLDAARAEFAKGGSSC